MVRFHTLLGSHLCTDPPEVSLVLAALAAFGGLRSDGMPMWDGAPCRPSLHDLASELGLHRAAIRRGVHGLCASMELDPAEGLVVSSRTVAERWRARTAVVRLDAGVRQLGLLSRPLLCAGVVAGGMPAGGQLELSQQRFTALTGLPRRTLQRAVGAAERAGSLHSWVLPRALGSRWCFGLGPCRKQAHEECREQAHEEGPGQVSCRKQAHEEKSGRVVNRRVNCREQAHTLSQSGARRDRTRRNQESSAADRHDPCLRLQMVLRKVLFADLRALDGVIQSGPLAKALDAQGLTAAEAERLWLLAQQQAEPRHAFRHWLGHDWQQVLQRSVPGEAGLG